MSEFAYLLDRITNAPILHEPFKHVEIKNFLRPEHLAMLIKDDQIHFPPCNNDRALVNALKTRGYEVIGFPGCTTHLEEYLIALREHRRVHVKKHQPVEGYGMAFRLKRYQNERIQQLVAFMNSEAFQQCLLKKFGLEHRHTSINTALQKYLTQYEISPHCDFRQKCMTYLLNINHNEAHKLPIHTYLLKLKEEHTACYTRWKTKTQEQRCWIPWSWCDVVKTISTNNTIVIFPPNFNTLHAVKLDYPHTNFQRTQIYGNLMFEGQDKPKRLVHVTWRDLEREKQLETNE